VFLKQASEVKAQMNAGQFCLFHKKMTPKKSAGVQMLCVIPVLFVG